MRAESGRPTLRDCKRWRAWLITVWCAGADIKADNLLHAIVDHSILDAFVRDEIEAPSPRKYVDGATPVYVSRRFGLPRDFGRIILSVFGTAVSGEVPRNDHAQPNVYRSPEVMLRVPWSYPADIWNVGAMIWDVFEGRHLFYGRYPTDNAYTSPRSSNCSDRRRWTYYNGGRGRRSSFRKTVGFTSSKSRTCGAVQADTTLPGKWIADSPSRKVTAWTRLSTSSLGITRRCFSALSGDCWRGGPGTARQRASCWRTRG